MSAAHRGDQAITTTAGASLGVPGRFWSWLRQDPMIRSLPRWLPIAVVNTTVMLSVVTLARRLPGGSLLANPFWDHAAWALCFWAAIAISLCSPGFRTRCGPFALAMPVPSRQLWLVHQVAVILSGAAILAVSGGLVAGIASLRALAPERAPLFEPDVTRLVIHLIIGLVLATALLQSRRPGLREIPADRRFVPFLAATIFGVLLLIVMLGESPTWVSLVPLGVAIAIAVRTYRTLPESFTLVPIELDAMGGMNDEMPGSHGANSGSVKVDDWPVAADAARSGAGRAWLLYSMIYQTLAKKPLVGLLILPLLFLFGMVLGGAFFGEDEDLRYSHIVMVSYILFAFSAPLTGRIHLLDHLPISRRRLFACVTVPSLFLICLGYGGGWLMAAWREEPKEQIEYRKEDRGHSLYVPLAACKIAWDGQPPENGSPWGESHTAWKVALYNGSRAVLYSPYSTPADGSVEFVAHQISRATEMIYGHAIPAEDIIDRYLDVDEGGWVSATPGGLTLERDHPELKPRRVGPEFPLLILASSVLWLILLAIYLRTFRTGISDGIRKAVYIAILVVTLGVHIGQFLLAITDQVELSVVAGFMQILVRALTEALPGGAVTVWIASGLLLLASYLVVESSFKRMEAVSGPWCGTC